MKCPHCLVEINPNFSETFLYGDKESFWSIFTMNCPNSNCGKMIIDLASGEPYRDTRNQPWNGLKSIKFRQTIRPFASGRSPVPPEVDELFAKDYNEACLILTFSPKASAALSRRCLQNVLREKAGVKKSDLSNEIQQIIDSKLLPSYLSKSIDAIRNIGNFAAHPLKSTSTGEIIDVEIGEAEWLLDVLEALFDFYFVQPSILKTKRDALDKKLADIGKPPMK
ncbi:MAG: hypothetical protein BWY08_00399 [Bacteroidetes bacterium ADurb.Bin174]|nr:MAG: hypothetical protein BWY08_00399 [Bacteroidetes bacterium ADurb.Bin174]